MSKKQANLVCLIVAAIWGGGFIATDAALQTFGLCNCSEDDSNIFAKVLDLFGDS